MTTPATPIKFYTMTISGHAQRVEMLLKALNLPFDRIEVDAANRQQKTPEFLAMNPFGQVPTIDDNGVFIGDSAAIMAYLVKRYDQDGPFMPSDPVLFAYMTGWLCKASGLLAYGPSTARRANIFGRPADVAYQETAQATSHALFSVMEVHLASADWLVGHQPTLADLALCGYTAHAPEGGVDLEPYPHIRAWLSRIEALPYFVPMPKLKVGLWAEEAAT